MKSKKYPNTGWGREAEAEDMEPQIEYERKQREPEEYKKTFEAAKKMQAEGKSSNDIYALLDTPPKPQFISPGGVVPQWAKVEHSVEQTMVFVRRKAVQDALATVPENPAE